MNQIRIPSLITINVAGHFKETQWGAIVEALINISVSLSLFFFTDLGLYGLLIGTVCSYIFRTTDVILYTHRHLVISSVWVTVKTFLINLFAMVLIYYMFSIAIPLHSYSILDWIVKAVVVSLISVLIFCVINFLFNREKIVKIISIVISKLKFNKVK